MRSAYNETWLFNLAVIKETKQWLKAKLIDEVQYKVITESYISSFYHPNFIIRILIFIATLMGLSGVTGVFALIILDTNETVISIGCIIYGITSFVFLDKAIIQNSKHYKSGLTEALLYHACGFTIGGVAGLTNFEILPLLLASVVILAFAAYRYLDLITTTCSLLTFAYLLFYIMFEWGGFFLMIMPFVFIIVFTAVYLLTLKLKRDEKFAVWNHNLIIVESLSLVIIYLAGNYLMVRELTVNMLGLVLEPGDDIPFAFLFYGLTILIPTAYLYRGIKKKDVVLLRTSLLVLAFSVFTFKYYYGFGHPEITLTLSGAILLTITLLLFNYLKSMRNGFTRENILTEKWSSVNAEAFIISQTMGGNQVNVDESFGGKGGSFGGGGSSGDF